MYIRMFILPKEESKCEERKVIICTLETCETCYHDHCDKEFLYVLDHSILTIKILLTFEFNHIKMIRNNRREGREVIIMGLGG